MSKVSVDAVNYSIFSSDVATVQSFDNCVSIPLPRNSVPFHGKLVRVTVLHPIDVPPSVNTILISRCIRCISRRVFIYGSNSNSLVVELGSELQCIGTSTFEMCSLHCLFLPQSVDFIGSGAFAGCGSIAFVYFHCHSVLCQLKSSTFAGLVNLRAITIPSSLRQIHRGAFHNCNSLLCVTFESPSQCWYIAFEAFSCCPQLQSFFLPPSVEVIDSSGYSDPSPPPRFFPSDSSHFYVENDCLVRIDDQKLILYFGNSPTFCFGAGISIVSEGNFADNDQLQRVVFDSNLRLKVLSACAFSNCARSQCQRASLSSVRNALTGAMN
jgi:hypothetical protein